MQNTAKTFKDYKARLKEKNRKLGTIIKILRSDRNMTQLQLAELLGICSQTMCHWESGKKTIPAGVIEDIALFLGHSVEDFFSIPKSKFEEIKFDVENAKKEKIEKIIKNIQKQSSRCLEVMHACDYSTIANI